MTALTGPRTDQIRIAGTGKILAAPVGTAAPADTVTAWGAAWLDLGYTDDSGVVFTKKDAFDDVPLWQTIIPGAKIPKSRDVEFKFNLAQINSTNLSLWGGGNAVVAGSGTGEWEFDITPTVVANTHAFGLEFSDSNGAIVYRFIVAKCQVTDTGDINITRTKALALPLTLAALAVDLTTPLVKILGKDANLAV